MNNKNLFCSFFLLVLLAYSIPVFAWPVPDTGQTKCYDDAGNEIACPNPGEPFYGQDGNYSINPRSYTKLDSNGNDLPDSAFSWAMVKDNVTGLIWEVKTDDASVHSKDNEYTFDDAQNVFIKSLNDENFGGYSDWRMPTIKELASITNKGTYNPAVYVDIFPDTKSDKYWSSTTGAKVTIAWGVSFDYGRSYYNYKSDSYYVRAVRGGQSWLFDNLIINNDGTVSDNNTGLMWQQITEDERMTWKNALEYCESLNLAGYNDWRLPTIEELRFIIDYSIFDPAVYVDIFPDRKSDRYWSSTTYAGYTNNSWGVLFINGIDDCDDKSGRYCVRAVRGGQSWQFDNLVISCGTSQANGIAPFEVTLTTTVSSGNPPYTFSYDFGDGTAGSIEQNVVHTYTTPGTYFPTVTVTDSQGQTATQSVTITVSEPPYENQAPIASITTDTSTGTSPLTVQFTGLGTDPEGQSLVYSWDFGDSQTALGMTASHIYTNPGTYTATLTVTDPEGLLATASVVITVSEPVVTEPDPSDESIGKAIIITGGGAHQQNVLFDISTEVCQKMYQLLKQRGFLDSDIIYMTPQAWQDIDGDGRDDGVVDYQLFDPQTELDQAFNTVSQSIESGKQFVFYIHGHGRVDNLSIVKGFDLSADALNSYFATFPQGVIQSIILDTCYSGSFIDDLKGYENRIVITSADDTSLAWTAEKGLSFSDRFIHMSRLGKDIKESFESARESIATNAVLYGKQSPQIDDNGDGLYSNSDGIKSCGRYIGVEGVSGSLPPSLNLVHSKIDLTENQISETLWVKTSETSEQIRKVRGILIKPDSQISVYTGEDASYENEEIELIYNPAQERYEKVYDNFRKQGRWLIVYQAQGIEGDWSDVLMGEVNSLGVSSSSLVTLNLNKSEYTFGEKLVMSTTVNGNERIDLYVALVFPAGYFMTITYPLSFNMPGAIIAYKTGIELSGEQTFPIMDIELPKGLSLGTYGFYSLITLFGSDPWNLENWIHYDFKTFELK